MLTGWKVPISFLSAICLPKSVAFKDWRLLVLTNVCNVLSIFVTHSLCTMLKTHKNMEIWPNFVVCTVSAGLFSKSPETLRRPCASKKYPYQEISRILFGESLYSWFINTSNCEIILFLRIFIIFFYFKNLKPFL